MYNIHTYWSFLHFVSSEANTVSKSNSEMWKVSLMIRITNGKTDPITKTWQGGKINQWYIISVTFGAKDLTGITMVTTELSKSLSCLSDVDNVSDLSNICQTYIFFTTSTELPAKSIKWFVYSFKWYLGILKVSTTHFCVTCGNIHTIQ